MTPITERQFCASALLLINGDAARTVSLYREADERWTWYTDLNPIHPFFTCSEGVRCIDAALSQLRSWCVTAFRGDPSVVAEIELRVVSDLLGVELYEPRTEFERDEDSTLRAMKGGDR